MIWLLFEEMLRAAASHQAAARAERPSYTGPLRRRTDAIDVEARVVEELPAPPVEAAP